MMSYIATFRYSSLILLIIQKLRSQCKTACLAPCFQPPSKTLDFRFQLKTDALLNLLHIREDKEKQGGKIRLFFLYVAAWLTMTPTAGGSDCFIVWGRNETSYIAGPCRILCRPSKDTTLTLTAVPYLIYMKPYKGLRSLLVVEDLCPGWPDW